MNAAATLVSSGKRALDLRLPWMNAAGVLGFSVEAAARVDLSSLGAFVTHPISLAARTPARGPRVVPYAGGILLHTGLPNPGLAATLRRHRSRWSGMPCQVIVHLLALDPAEAALMAEAVESIEDAAAIEIGLSECDPTAAAALVQAAGAAQLPVLAQVPLTASEAVALAAAQAGAAAVVVAAPRGCLPADDGQIVCGRLYGPSLFPLAMQTVRQLVVRLGCAVIAGAGVYSADQAQAMLATGAVAVQFDTVLWTEPEAVLPPKRTGDAGDEGRTSPFGV